jgi:hypothetical protein
MSDDLADLQSFLLPGVPPEKVLAILQAAGGNELGSGKFTSPESSSALAVNGFGPFLADPISLPPFPCLPNLDWPATRVDVERQMRFPWSGGRHPWLDAVVETDRFLIGVESKRLEPFRDVKHAKLSDAYDRDVWGAGMEPWCEMRDRLRANPREFRYLDAAQLVKHAYGLVTQARKIGKAPILLYLFAEPTAGRAISPEHFAHHRAEIDHFSRQVDGSTVRFSACSWRDWLAAFDGPQRAHADRLLQSFAP